MLYISDEVFFSGTAAEITPIRSIDKIVIEVDNEWQNANKEVVAELKTQIKYLMQSMNLAGRIDGKYFAY